MAEIIVRDIALQGGLSEQGAMIYKWDRGEQGSTKFGQKNEDIGPPDAWEAGVDACYHSFKVEGVHFTTGG